MDEGRGVAAIVAGDEANVTMTATLQGEYTGMIAAVAAAGAVGTFILLLRPNRQGLAVTAAILVFLISAGAVAVVKEAL